MKEEDRKIGPEIHCTDLKLSRNLSAHVRKSGVDEVTMMHGWIIRYLYETYGNRIYISMMSQYTPVGDIGVRFPELADKVRRKSYRKLLDYAVKLGVEQAFYQEGEVAEESFIPEFYKE